MTRMLKAVAVLVAGAGLMVSALGQVPMQTVQDSVDMTDPASPRLVIDGQPLFISGMNLAWNNFARDVGPTAISGSTMANYIKQIRSAGGNAMRWWLHTDAQVDPVMDMSTGAVTGIGANTINNMRTVLDSAYKYGVVVSMCLFSFDLLKNDNNKSSEEMARNYKFLTESANLDTYIQNALIPILDSIGNHPAIMCWEVFNEPEGMATGYGWATQKIDHSHIIRFTSKIAGEVHRRTKKMASTGIHNFHNYVSLYTMEKLKAVDPDGWLDFYMAHHYPEYESRDQSPFTQPASHWGFDRPVLIGEFPAQDMGPGGYNFGFVTSNPISIIDAYEWAYQNGYLGAMAWSITEGNKDKFGTMATAAPALRYMYDNYTSEIEVKSGVGDIEIPTGDLAMRITAQGMSVDGNIINKSTGGNFSGKTNVTFEMYIADGSGTNVEIIPVIQVGSGWTWCESSATIDLANHHTGVWTTVTVPVSSYAGASGNLGTVQAMAFKLAITGGSSYTGTIYIDDIKVDGATVYDFDDALAVWDMEGPWDNNTNSPAVLEGVTVVNVARPGGSASIRYGTKAAGAIGRAPIATVRGKTLSVVGADNSEMSIRLINVNGKTVARFKAQGRGQFSLVKVPAGRYVVETKVGGKRVGTSGVVVR